MVEHLGEFDPKRGSVRAWVLRIARNAVIDHYRTRKRAVPLELDSLLLNGVQDGPLDHMIADERTARIRELLATCPDETRTMLAMRYGDGLRHAEIAELLGLGEAVVRKRISRAVSDLRSRSRVLEDGREDKPVGREASPHADRRSSTGGSHGREDKPEVSHAH